MDTETRPPAPDYHLHGDVLELADLAGFATPDGPDSPGAEYLNRVEREVVDYVEAVAVTYGGDDADPYDVAGELAEQARNTDLHHDMADSLADLVYSDTIARVAHDLRAEHQWLPELEADYGRDYVAGLLFGGTGHYPGGIDALRVACLYHGTRQLVAELLEGWAEAWDAYAVECEDAETEEVDA